MIRTEFRSLFIIEWGLFELTLLWILLKYVLYLHFRSYAFVHHQSFLNDPLLLLLFFFLLLFLFLLCFCFCFCFVFCFSWTARDGFWNIYLCYLVTFLVNFVLLTSTSPLLSQKTQEFLNKFCRPGLICAFLINGNSCDFWFLYHCLPWLSYDLNVPCTSNIIHGYKEISNGKWIWLQIANLKGCHYRVE